MKDDFENVYDLIEHAIEYAFDGKMQLKFYDFLKYRKTTKAEVDAFLQSSTAKELADEVLELQEYIKQEDIQQVFKLNMFRYSDNNGEKDQFTDWARSKEIKGNGGFKTYGKARTDYDKKQDDKKKNKNK